jgi:hypothetical protein
MRVLFSYLVTLQERCQRKWFGIISSHRKMPEEMRTADRFCHISRCFRQALLQFARREQTTSRADGWSRFSIRLEHTDAQRWQLEFRREGLAMGGLALSLNHAAVAGVAAGINP